MIKKNDFKTIPENICQPDEDITINIPTSNKFGPFQTTQDYSTTNTTLPLENRLSLNSILITCQGKILTKSPDSNEAKPLTLLKPGGL